MSTLADYQIEQTIHVAKGHKVVVAHRLHESDDIMNVRQETVAIRLRVGSIGYTEWLNELQVYMMPDFKHNNILEFLSSDKRLRNQPNLDDYKVGQQVKDCEGMSLHTLKFNDSGSRKGSQKNSDSQSSRTSSPTRPPSTISYGHKIRVEYWITTRFENCITLREYLRFNLLTWPQMLDIAQGIIEGVHYLHELADFQDIDRRKAVDNFIRSTNGALKKVSFVDQDERIYMEPHLSISIIHRNLTSMNIVLRSGQRLVPCIWNFGQAYVQHPFQPINHQQLIDPETKEEQKLSPYSPPEVLLEKGHLTLAAMKSIDMYACGMLLWELISRCILPKLEPSNAYESHERNHPDEYSVPLSREINDPNKSLLKNILCHAVVNMRARPRIKFGWLVGKMTNRYVQTLRDLWDHDFDARLHTTTVLDRLSKLSRRDTDRRFKCPYQTSVVFVRRDMWPPQNKEAQAPSQAKKCQPNICFEDVESDVDSIAS